MPRRSVSFEAGVSILMNLRGDARLSALLRQTLSGQAAVTAIRELSVLGERPSHLGAGVRA